MAFEFGSTLSVPKVHLLTESRDEREAAIRLARVQHVIVDSRWQHDPTDELAEAERSAFRQWTNLQRGLEVGKLDRVMVLSIGRREVSLPLFRRLTPGTQLSKLIA